MADLEFTTPEFFWVTPNDDRGRPYRDVAAAVVPGLDDIASETLHETIVCDTQTVDGGDDNGLPETCPACGVGDSTDWRVRVDTTDDETFPHVGCAIYCAYCGTPLPLEYEASWQTFSWSTPAICVSVDQRVYHEDGRGIRTPPDATGIVNDRDEHDRHDGMNQETWKHQCPMCGDDHWPPDEPVETRGGGRFDSVTDAPDDAPLYHPECRQDWETARRSAENYALDEFADDTGPRCPPDG